MTTKAFPFRFAVMTASMLALGACGGFDMDLRGTAGGFDTSEAVRNATATRPVPDERGVISYPGYQVAIARRGDTISTVASRIGTDPGRGLSSPLCRESANIIPIRVIRVPGACRPDCERLLQSGKARCPSDRGGSVRAPPRGGL